MGHPGEKVTILQHSLLGRGARAGFGMDGQGEVRSCIVSPGEVQRLGLAHLAFVDVFFFFFVPIVAGLNMTFLLALQ